MIIVWRGAGILVVGILIVFGILEHFIMQGITGSTDYTEQHSWPLALTFFISAITVWFFGKYLNDKEVLVRESHTNEVKAIKNFHHLMFIPMQYFAIPLILGSMITLWAGNHTENNKREDITPNRPSLVDPVSFNTHYLALQVTNKNSKNWLSSNGDILTLYYAHDEIDAPNISASLKEIRDFYRDKAASMDSALIEADKFQTNGINGFRVITRTPLENLAMEYNGYIIIPDSNSYYIFKMSCKEEGATGEREAVVMDQLMAEKKIKINEKDGTISGWSQDPYDANYNAKAKIMRNISEDKKYDQQFPRHPLSRLRAIFDQIQPSIKLANNAQNNNQVDKSTEKSN